MPGVEATVAVALSGGPGRDRVVLARCTQGEPPEVLGPAGGDAEVTFSLSEADGAEIVAGRLSPSVAFMQGRLKTSGDPGLVLDLLAATASPAFGEWLGRLGAGS